MKLMESLWFRIRLELRRDIVPADKITIQQPAFLLSVLSVSQSTNAAIVPMQLFVGPERELNQWNTELLKSGLSDLIYSMASQTVA